jgi:hypothetical protein
MLLFRSEEHLDRWRRRWKLPRGAVLTLEKGWQLARAWYDDRMKLDWRAKTVEESEAAFKILGLRPPFWRMNR